MPIKNNMVEPISHRLPELDTLNDNFLTVSKSTTTINSINVLIT